MNKTKIEWCDYTWNPVVGCKNGCFYCYAKRMNDRFQWIPDWKDPQIFISRLMEPHAVKKGGKIFVCSMADLFGDWIDKKWIELVIKVAKENPHHTFMFLTKNPKRYLEFKFPDNCWLGLTINNNNQAEFEKTLVLIKAKDEGAGKKIFISIEPIFDKFDKEFNQWFKEIDLIIVGAMTGPKAIVPKPEWIESIKHPNIFYKDNIKKYLPVART